MNIEDIIKGCKEGNRKCQDALVQKFAPGLLALCYRYTSDRELARDALQECFINVFRYLDKYEGKGSFEGWMKRIAVTSSISLQKKYKNMYFDEVNDTNSSQYADVPDIYASIGTEEIMGLIKQLPQSLYLVFNLNVVEGYSHVEIAEMLHITDSTSRAALCKARHRLTELIKKQEAVSVAHAS
ncbi:MAG: sigma-70 family RNA polymerase sigma factor [Saprospiraceae bacterium]